MEFKYLDMLLHTKKHELLITIMLTTILFTSSSVCAAASLIPSNERNPFAMTKALVDILTEKTEEKNKSGLLMGAAPTNTLINGLPEISLQAVSLSADIRRAILKKPDGSTLLVAEGDRLYLMKEGEYVEMNILEIKPRSILIQLGAKDQIIEVQ